MRSELFHPLFAHFPIVLLSLYPFLVGSTFILKAYREVLSFAARGALYLGLLTQFVSMYLGDLALEKLAAYMCKLQLAYEHENQARLTLLTFILVVAVDVLDLSKKVNKLNLLNSGKLLFSIIGLWFVIQTAHTGATMVYDYGVAVKVPAACKAGTN